MVRRSRDPDIAGRPYRGGPSTKGWMAMVRARLAAGALATWTGTYGCVDWPQRAVRSNMVRLSPAYYRTEPMALRLGQSGAAPQPITRRGSS